MVKSKKHLTIFAKGSILDILEDSEYASGCWNLFFLPIFNISKPCTLMLKEMHDDHAPSLFFFAKPDALFACGH